MKYYIIAGEASGDLYGAQLMTALSEADEHAEFRFWGGDEMKKVSSNQAMDYSKTAFMGFWEVIKNINTVRQLFSFCKEDIVAFQPDKIIFIDYPGFNLRMAAWAKQKNYQTIYFVAPQIWAWKKNRYKQIKRDIDQLFVILPFEKGFYKGLGVEATYYGHPLTKFINAKQEQAVGSSLHIALLPGSRKQELEKHLPIFLQVMKSRPEDQFSISVAPTVTEEMIKDILGTIPNNLTFNESTDDILQQADLAIVKSGTSTMQAALYHVPQVVIYKTSALSYAIGKRVVKLPFISLVNIIAGKMIVSELIQDGFNLKNINEEIARLINPQVRQKMMNDYAELRTSLEGEDVFANIAADILK